MPPPLGPPFAAALEFAARLHAGQFRKGTTIPYVAHVLAVAALALEAGADEEVAMAALLHDTAEDCGGQPVIEEIRARFGPRVAGIVAECSDTFVVPKPPWMARKTAYLAHLPEASEGAKLVCACDKLHNLRSMIRDLRAQGPSVWERFNAKPAAIIWYYQQVAEILSRGPDSLILVDLRAAVAKLDLIKSATLG